MSKPSHVENAMIELLKDYPEGLPIIKIVEYTKQKYPDLLTGKKPQNSLYSIIYRREKKRIKNQKPPLFNKKIIHRETLYFLDNKNL